MGDTASPNVSNTETENAPVSPSTLKKSKSKTTTGAKRVVKKTEAKKPMRPKTSEMVFNAIKELNERKGSSLQAIKKQIAATHKVDTDKLALFIRKYLKSAVVSGELTQTKGNGASGSFKIPQPEKKTLTKSSSTVIKKKVVKKDSKAATSPKKLVKAAKKTPTDKKKAVKTTTKKEKTPAAQKSVKSKVTKTLKTAPKEKKSAKKLPTVKKAKSPKVKKIPASKSKKASPKKK